MAQIEADRRDEEAFSSDDSIKLMDMVDELFVSDYVPSEHSSDESSESELLETPPPEPESSSEDSATEMESDFDEKERLRL